MSETENFEEAANRTKANGFEKVVNDKIEDMQTEQVRSAVKVETKGSKVEFKTKVLKNLPKWINGSKQKLVDIAEHKSVKIKTTTKVETEKMWFIFWIMYGRSWSNSEADTPEISTSLSVPEHFYCMKGMDESTPTRSSASSSLNIPGKSTASIQPMHWWSPGWEMSQIWAWCKI